MNEDRGRLVIGLKEGEGVSIGDDIVVTIHRVNHKVELAIEAPKSVFIRRDKYKDKNAESKFGI
jgi:carbon storage regulator CsrA